MKAIKLTLFFLALVCIGLYTPISAQETPFFTNLCSTATTVTENCDDAAEFTISVSGVGVMGADNSGIVEAFFDISGFFGTITLVSPDGQEFVLADTNEGPIPSFPEHNGGLLRVNFRTCESLPYHFENVGGLPDGLSFRPVDDFTVLNDGVTNADGDWTLKMCGLPDDFTVLCGRITFGPICPELELSTVPSTCNTSDGGIDFTTTPGACSNILVNINGNPWENASNLTGWFTLPGEYTVCWGEELITSLLPAVTCEQCSTLIVPVIDTEPPTFDECLASMAIPTDEFCQGVVTVADPTPIDNCEIINSTATMLDPDGNTVFLAPLAPGVEFPYTLDILGDYQLIFSTEDLGGNITTCEITLTLEDQSPPTWNDSNIFTATGECGVDAPQTLIDNIAATFAANMTDNCSPTEDINFAFLNFTAQTNCGSSVTFTDQYSLSDGAGNESTLLGIIELTMEDTNPPVLSNVPANVTVNCDEVFPTIPTVTALDACAGNTDVDITVISESGSCTLNQNNEIFTYTFTSTDGCDNTVSADWTVTVFNDQAVSLGPDINSCESFTETLTTSGLGGTYIWSTGASTPTITVSTGGVYAVTVTGLSGCCSEDEVTVTFDPLPNATAAGGTLDCSGNPVQLIATSSISGSSYAWSGPGGFTSSIQNPVVSQAGTYTVTVSGPSGFCSDVASTVVLANTDVPDISTAGGAINCNNAEVMLTGTSTTAGVTYLWTGPGGFTSTSQNPTVTVGGTYELTVTAPNACIAEGVAIVTEDTEIPTLSLVGGELNCDATTITLSPTTSDPDAAFSWTGPGGFNSTASNINVTLPGDYALVITSDNGCTNTATATVIEDIAIPNLAVAGETITCASPAAQLTATSTTNGVTYLWSGPNGFDATTPDPTTTVAGEYTIVVEAANGCTATASVTVSEDTTPPTSTGGSAQLNCNNTMVTLPLTVTGTSFTVAWTGPGGYTSMAQNPAVQEPGTYTATVTGSNGCTSQATTTVNEDIAAPDATAVGGSITCTNNNVQIVGSSTTGGISFDWTGPNDFTSAIQSPTVGAPGNYILTVTAPNGCTSTATAEVTADGDLPNISATGGELTCIALEVTLSGNSTTTGVSFLWTGPEGFSSTMQNPTVAIAGIYTLTVTAENGCESATQINILNNNATPMVSATGGMISCTASSTTVTAIAPSATSFLWSGPGGFTSTLATPTVTSAGEYIVVVTAANGCTSQASATVTSDDQLPSVVALGGTLTCENTSVILTANSSDQVTYSWTGPGAFTSTMQNPIVTLPGDYVLTVIAPNGCSASTTVTVDQDADLPLVSIDEPEIDCAAGTATLRVLSSADLTYRWTYEGVVISTGEIVVISEVGNYEVIAISENGCEVALSYTLDEPIGTLTSEITTTDATSTEGGTASIVVTGTATSIVWDNGDTGIMTTDLPAGTRTVTVTDIYGCIYTIEFVISMSTATIEIEGLNTYEVYPTATQATTTVNAQFANNKIGRLILYGLDGKIVQEVTFRAVASINRVLDLTELPAGVYVLTLAVGTDLKTTKLVKY